MGRDGGGGGGGGGGPNELSNVKVSVDRSRSGRHHYPLRSSRTSPSPLPC